VQREDAAAQRRRGAEIHDQQLGERRDDVAAEQPAELDEARVRPPWIVGLEEDGGDEEDRGVNGELGLVRRAEILTPVLTEAPVRRPNPAGGDRGDVQRDERGGPDRDLRARSRNHDWVSAATRVPQATIVQNTPMILYDTNVSTSSALADAAVTASAAAYTIARRSGSVCTRTRRPSIHTSEPPSRRN